MEKVESKPSGNSKIMQLIKRGVDIPNPLTIHIGDEVHLDNISTDGVIIYPGCRIYGEKTVISAGVRLGYEAPVTVDNCQLGPMVELKGGYFTKSVFLESANMGSGAQVREACILEEQAGGAHCVGLKHTILFPFVTLGSLINFCDCLMAGGTSRKAHSEVGSSYIHFNFTPEGDKATASLIGDVPQGVMLDKSPIFLGGQGGMVGPLRIGYGNVVAAGSILRKDLDVENKLVVGKGHYGAIIDRMPGAYPNLARIIENNILYISNLLALEQWYIHVRKIFFEDKEFGILIHAGVLEKLQMAKGERIKRLKDMAAKIKKTSEENIEGLIPAKKELSTKVHLLEELLDVETAENTGLKERERFLHVLIKNREEHGSDYIRVIQGLPVDTKRDGTEWLNHIVRVFCKRIAEEFPALNMFKKMRF